MIVFTYWTGRSDDIAPFKAAWSAVGIDAKVYTDDDVIPILHRMNPIYVEIYTSIRIAACKSDIARIALLYEYGGFYVDAHGAPNNAAALDVLFADLARWELVIFDEPLNHEAADDIHILTGALAARRGSDLLAKLILGIMRNLMTHARRQAASAQRLDYNIFVLSGPWEIRLKLVSLTKPYGVIPQLQSRVAIVVLPQAVADRAFHWYVNYGYRRPGQHWSERQKLEPLFETRATNFWEPR